VRELLKEGKINLLHEAERVDTPDYIISVPKGRIFY